MSDVATETSNGWQRWQIALAIGLPVGVVTIATGCLIYYWWKDGSVSTSHDQLNKSSSKDQDDPVTITTSSSVNMQDSKASHDPTSTKTPLEQAEQLKTTGNKYFKGKKYDSALRCYEEAIKLCPSDQTVALATYNQNMAACYELMAANETDESLKASNYHEVIRLTTDALKLNKKYVKAYTRRARASEHFKLHNDVLYDFTAIMLLDPTQVEKNQEKCNDIVRILVTDQIKHDYPEGKKLVNLSHTFVASYHESFCYHGYVNEEEVMKLLEPINGSCDKSDNVSCDGKEEGKSRDELNQHPYIQAVREFHAGNYGNIIPLCSKAVESEDSGLVAMALLLRGEMNFLWQHREEALQDLQRVTDMSDVSTEIRIHALLQRAHIFLDSMETSKAQEECDKALILNSSYGDIYVQMTKINMILGTPEGMMRALQQLEQAYQLSPDYYNALINLAYMKFRFGANSMQTIESSRQLFDKAISQFSKQAEVYVMYGQMLQDCMQIDEAIQMFQKAIDLQPNIASTYVYLGLLHVMSRKDINSAIATIDKGLKADPYCMLAYMTLGSLELQR